MSTTEVALIAFFYAALATVVIVAMAVEVVRRSR